MDGGQVRSLKLSMHLAVHHLARYSLNLALYQIMSSLVQALKMGIFSLLSLVCSIRTPWAMGEHQ